MSKLIYVEASPRKERSHSISVAQAYLEAYQAAHPDDTVETWDLWDLDLPAFDGAVIDAKYRILHGEEHTAEEAAAWQAVVDLTEKFKSADRYLFSVPMWNFGIPYKLKHFLDVISQPGLTFSFSPEEGYSGLVTGRPAVVVYSRGGAYSEGTGLEGLDHQKPYLDFQLGFLGITDVTPIVIEPTLAAGPEGAAKAREAAAEEARKLGRASD